MKRVWWYYWKRQKDTKEVKLKLHWKGRSYLVHKVICKIPCQSKSRKSNPVVVMETKSKQVEVSFVKGPNSRLLIVASIC